MLWIISTVLVGSALWFAWGLRNAPEGYEDDSRCDITGQPLTPRQRFDQGTGVY